MDLPSSSDAAVSHGASESSSGISSVMDKSGSAVRVGVRVRPFSAKEISASGSSESVLTCSRDRTQEIRLGSRRFTYDAVFDQRVSQESLYQSVAGPLMENFLEGYNATIMAYGQTGSGKTYTMGSEAHDDTDISSQTGIIPRFMRDLFASLEKRKEVSDSSSTSSGPALVEYDLTASFLEVYGEDVHDLLVPSRPSVPIREDANGGIVCVGLTEFPISTAQDALQVLHEGTLHRTTAATLMNLTSSRSHAVFAVTLKQKMAVPSSAEQTTTTTVSRLTFVDLAGSERMKKTGAEGERAREGIKINEGLLALGNVINALADQKRINEGKKVHVPYRQSKLTRLLQDALGGNSQTLFLACVSPSDTNASETLSTLHYANRARNIRNAPVQNVDAGMLELQRLRAWSQLLQNELLRHKFGANDKSEPMGKIDDEILVRGEVQEYLQELQSLALQENGNSQACSSLAFLPVTNAPKCFTSPTPMDTDGSPTLMDIDVTMNQSVLENYDPALLAEVNPDHEMAILNQLLELQHRDQAFDDEQKEESQALKEMEGELAEQESMLLQLRDSLKVYHNIKNKYEILMTEVQQLEAEKTQLATQLEKATADPSQGCSSAIKKQLDKVEKSLARARDETRKHRDQYRRLEKEAQKCQVLERKITELKNGRATMIKKQRDAAVRHREYTEAKAREIMALKRKERNAEKKVSKLQTEVQIHKRNLEKRQQFITKLNDKLKQTESNLMKLLSTRQRNLQDRMSVIHRRSSVTTRSSVLPMDREGIAPASSSEVKSASLLLNHFIEDRVTHFQVEQQYQRRVEEYGIAMKDMLTAVDELRQLKNQDIPDSETLSDALQSVDDTELKVELIAADLENLRTQLKEKESADEMETKLLKVMANQPVSVLRQLLIGLMDQQILSEQRRASSDSALLKKERTVDMLEQEIDLLNRKLTAYASENAKRKELEDSDRDPIARLRILEEENNSLATAVKVKEEEIASIKDDNVQLQKTLSEISTSAKEMEQKLATLDAAGDKEAHAERALEVLSKVQTIWREIGTPLDTDDGVLHSIQNCLENTCEQKLEDARNKRDHLKVTIDALKARVEKMQASLGRALPSVETFPNLVSEQQFWEGVMKEVSPIFDAANYKSNELVAATTNVQSALGLVDDDLPASLQRLAQEGSSNETPRNLTDKFLAECEKEVSALRVRKSEIIVKNGERQHEVYERLKEMNLAENSFNHFILGALEHREDGTPTWWNVETAQTVSQKIASESLPGTTKEYTDHLVVIQDSVASVAKGHQLLSEGLQELIERAQQTLLSTVEGGHDAVEACANFRDALLRLPKLSKERIETCLSQMADLIQGVDAMIQSEIEALTVVWEALETPTSDRGQFWGTIDENLSTNVPGAFEDVLAIKVDPNGWLKSTARQGAKDYTSLDKKLFKLQAVHGEVEKLRALQNAKSQVLSLDSEVRLLNAQLAEFEDHKCNKDRLLSRQTTSSHLLKEERYRKQMKVKFSTKLKQLAELLKLWNEKNSKDFDPSILSEDVRMLLKNDSWINQRKEFMHLRTTKSNRAGKRRIERTGSSESEESPSPPKKKQNSSINVKPVAGAANSQSSKASANGATDPQSTTPKPTPRKGTAPRTAAGPRSVAIKRKTIEVKSAAKADVKKRRTVAKFPSKESNFSSSQPTTRKDPPRNVPRAVLSPTHNVSGSEHTKGSSKNKRLTLPPFGHVLEQTSSTPRSKSLANEENDFEKK